VIVTSIATFTAALDLIDQAIPVFPVAPDKSPLIKDWRNRASVDPHQIEKWFRSIDCLIGIPTGPQSNYDVLDIDPRHEGHVWFEANQHRLPVTRWRATRDGGRHLLFRFFKWMRNSEGKIAPGVDVRATGGYVVYWPAHGLDHSLDPITEWPDWLLELAMQGRAQKRTSEVDLDIRKPPSPWIVVDLLERMPNRLETTRGTYVDVMHAARGCIDALIEAGELDDFDQEIAIAEAAIHWAERWEGYNGTDEAEKWESDWSHRTAPLAGWQTLTRVAGELIPGYREEQAAKEFADPPRTSAYHGNPHWPSMLQLNKNGGIKPMFVNASLAFRHAPEWQNVYARNLFDVATDVRQRPPCCRQADFTPHQLTDIDVFAAIEWLQVQGIGVSKTVTEDAIHATAAEHPYHPVRDYLDDLIWDRTPRIDTWLIDHLGATDAPLHRAYGARFLISAIARVRQPGCKVDTVPILEGRQGLLKSAVLRTLASDVWFTDHMPDLHSKDAQLQLQGCWFIEFAEYGQFSRADANHAKVFISTQADRFRAPYDRRPESHPRQCVLVVTLNPGASGYLKDDTGNRRFWPIQCGAGWPLDRQINIEALAAVRDQLWAEADYRFGQKEPWWIREPALVRAQEASTYTRLDHDPLFDRITKALVLLAKEGTEEPTFDDICLRLGFLAAKDVTRQVQLQIGRTMTILGWNSHRERRNGAQQTVYKKLG
jgi:hypothetical protein